jgi:TolB-like protein
MSDSARAVFLSYASQDAVAVLRLAEALRASGIVVWFDKDELVGGDAWDAKIRGQIASCALFVPVISAATQARLEGYFRIEWKLAARRTHAMATARAFLLPVVIDETREAEAHVPDEFRDVQWTRLPGGEATEAFSARVKALLSGPVMEAGRPRPVERGEGAASPTVRKVGRRVPVAAWLAAAIALAAVVAFFTLRPASKENAGAVARPPAAEHSTAVASSPTRSLPNDKSMAILPFANLSPDKENEFFADGVHADLLSNLIGLRELRVISAQSVAGYRGTTKRIPEIARELGVAYLMTGSVRRAANSVRVSAQLIDARTDTPIWSPQPYDKNLSDIFAIQSEIAQAIAVSLKAVLTTEEQKHIFRRTTENLAAYDLYLKGIIEGGSGRAGYEHTERHMRAAVELDPKFVEAWGWLLRVQSFIYRNYDLTEERLRTTTATYETLKRLAPDATATILPFARYALWVQADFDRAIAEAERYVRLLPNDAEGYFLLEVIQFRQGRLAEAIANLRKSIALEPTYLGYRYNLIGPLEGCRRYDEVIQEYQAIRKYDPASREAPWRSAIAAFLGRGSTREGDQVIAMLSETTATSPDGIAQRMNWSEMKGDLAEFIRLDALLPETSGRSAISRAQRLALALVASGDQARAVEVLTPRADEAMRRAETPGTDLSAWRLAGEVAAILQRKDEAMRCLRKLGEIEDIRLRPAQSAAEKLRTIAFVHAWLGDKSRAVAEYEKLFRMPFSGLSPHEMRRNARYFPLRGDPRFEALLNDPKNNAPLF